MEINLTNEEIVEEVKRRKNITEAALPLSAVLIGITFFIKSIISEDVSSVLFALILILLFGILFYYDRCPKCSTLMSEYPDYCVKCGARLIKIEGDTEEPFDSTIGSTVDQNRIFKISTVKFRVISVGAFLLFFLFAVYFSFVTFDIIGLSVSILFSALSLYLVLLYGKLVVSKRDVTQYTVVGVYRIYWDEVVEIQYSQGILVLIGRSKRLSIPDLEYWTDNNASDATGFFYDQAEKRNIELSKSMRALIMPTKNSRINAHTPSTG